MGRNIKLVEFEWYNISGIHNIYEGRSRCIDRCRLYYNLKQKKIIHSYIMRPRVSETFKPTCFSLISIYLNNIVFHIILYT